MPRLRTTNTSDFLPHDEIVETLLVETGTADQLPTDESQVLRFLGLEQLSFDFMHEVDFLEGTSLPKSGLRAALSLSDRVIATQAGMGEGRTRFCMFHEIGHCVLPEHHERIFVDTDQTLSWWTKARLEKEANEFAADMLFQGHRFTNEALSMALSLQSVVDLAPKYGASFEAAFRRYVERHVMPCALVVYDKVAREDESYVEDQEYKPHYTITSSSFRSQYFSGQVTADKCSANEIFKSAWRVGQVVPSEVIVDGGPQTSRFAAEVFSNSYKIFQFLVRPLKKKR